MTTKFKKTNTIAKMTNINKIKGRKRQGDKKQTKIPESLKNITE